MKLFKKAKQKAERKILEKALPENLNDDLKLSGDICRTMNENLEGWIKEINKLEKKVLYIEKICQKIERKL